MALLSLTEFKASATYLLNTTKYSTDATTSQLILDAEDNYLSVRGKPFKKITGTYTSGSAEISEIPAYDMVGLAKGQKVADDNIRGEIIDIDTDNSTITLNSNATDDGDAVELFVYPEQSLNVAIRLVNFLRNQYLGDETKKAEAIEKHSWTNWGPMDTKYGIPKSISSRIKSFAHIQEGQKTGQGYYKGQEEISVSDQDTVIINEEVTVTE